MVAAGRYPINLPITLTSKPFVIFGKAEVPTNANVATFNILKDSLSTDSFTLQKSGNENLSSSVSIYYWGCIGK